MADLPAEPEKDEQDENGRSPSGRFLAINNLHYHANELSELRKLAEVSPELAEKVIEQRDRESQRIAASYNLGLLVSVALLTVTLISLVLCIIFAGVFETLLAIVGILAVALLVRVVLTGEWSDTSWFGQLMKFILKTMGGRSN